MHPQSPSVRYEMRGACKASVFMSSRGGAATAYAIPLPEELLIYIFDLATYNPTRDINSLVDLKPFEKDYSTDIDALCDAPLGAKRALVLTCERFKRLVGRYLFEDIRIRHGSEAFAENLERNPELGLFVKRVSIALEGYKDSGHWIASYPKGTKRILQKCGGVVVLTRHIDLQDGISSLHSHSADVNLDDIQFPHLRRVDWFNGPDDSVPSTLPTPKFVWKSDSLQTLTVGPDYFPIQVNISPIVDLPNLRTIRLRSLYTPGNTEDMTVDPSSVRLPVLRKLVFSLPDGGYTLFFGQFLRACGPRIEEVEIEPHPRFLDHDFISVFLLNCSNATTLNFPVFLTKPTRKNTRRQAVQIGYLITHIGLSAAGFQGELRDDDGNSQWSLLARHFIALFGEKTRFSNLERLTLYGEEWASVFSDPWSKKAVKLVQSRKVEIECEYDSVARRLKTVCQE